MTCELSGELTIGTAAQIRAQLVAALEQGGSFEVDTCKVTEVDTAGMQLLVVALTTAASKGMVVCYPAAQHGAAVHEALANVGLADRDWAEKAAKV